MRKILWVDDDPLILSSARRLLQIHGFTIDTLENPLEVQAWLTKNEAAVIVSDQRMPQMTGVQLLAQVKNSHPLITRIMVTGFMDPDLVRQAKNDADIFRFITKPWNEEELIADIVQGLEHFEKVQEKDKLNVQVREQNKALQVFTDNLEGLIAERTLEIANSKKEQESKNSKIKSLVHFIQNINEMNDPLEVVDYFFNELKKEVSVLNCFFSLTNANNESKIYFRFKNKWNIHSVQKPWSQKKEIRFFDDEDRNYIANETKLPLTNIIAVPLLKYKEDLSLPHTIFVEIDRKGNVSDRVVDFITSRLQVLSLGLDKILFKDKLLQESKRWEKTFDSISDPLCVLTSGNEIVRQNIAFERQIGFVSQDFLASPQKTTTVHDRIYNIHMYEIKNEESRFKNFLCYFRDITHERELYQKLVQGEKIAAVGLLAGNIAHELNNPLTGIRSMSQIWIESGILTESQMSDFIEIEKASARCQEIIQSLIDFSETKENKNEKICIQEVIQKTMPLLKTALRHHRTEVVLPEKKIYVSGNFQLLQQVLFNIVNNACQAMKDPGTVGIEIQENAERVCLLIWDTGPGISEKHKHQLFESFFTTKKEGEGTGLGLSFSKNVIEKMGGTIRLDPLYQEGALFEISLIREAML